MSSGEYWWERKILRNISRYPDGLSQTEIIEHTGIEHDLVGGALSYFGSNGYLKKELVVGDRKASGSEEIANLLESALDGKRPVSIIPVYSISKKGLKKLNYYNTENEM